MKTNVLFLLTVVSAYTTVAQTAFNKRYGSYGAESGEALTVAADGSFLVTGKTTTNGSGGNMFILKINQNGNVEWQKDLSGVNEDVALYIDELENGNLIVGGRTYSFGSGCNDAQITKTDSEGNVLWSKAYGDVQCNTPFGFSTTTDGVVGCGAAIGSSTEGWIFNTNAEGRLLWSKQYSLAKTLHSVKPLHSGDGFVAVGSGSSISILKTDLNGNVIWFREFISLPGSKNAYDVISLEDGSFVLTGQLYHNAYGGIADIFLLKVDASGNETWFKQYGFTFQDYGKCVQQAADGGFIIAGYTNSSGFGDWDAVLLKTDASGNLEWAKTYGKGWRDQAEQVIVLEDGYCFTGNSYSFENVDSSYVYLVKTDLDGETSCQYQDWNPLELSQSYESAVVNLSVSDFGTDSLANSFSSGLQLRESDICNPNHISEIESVDIRIYPNPTSDYLTVSGLSETTSITIADIRGRELTTVSINYDTPVLNLSSFESGVYILSTKTWQRRVLVL